MMRAPFAATTLALALAGAFTTLVAAGPSAIDAAPVRDAIVAAIRQRVGVEAEVLVRDARIVARPGSDAAPAGHAAPIALPDPSARLGTIVRFALVTTRRDGGAEHAVRYATVDAHVSAIVTVVRAARVIARGQRIAAEDVSAEREDIAGEPLQPLPALLVVVGARALKDLAPGERLTTAAVVVPASVRTGQEVTAITRIDGVEATALLVAGDSGSPGDVIRVLNRSSRRTMRARVLSSSTVEIIP